MTEPINSNNNVPIFPIWAALQRGLIRVQIDFNKRPAKSEITISKLSRDPFIVILPNGSEFFQNKKLGERTASSVTIESIYPSTFFTEPEKTSKMKLSKNGDAYIYFMPENHFVTFNIENFRSDSIGRPLYNNKNLYLVSVSWVHNIVKKITYFNMKKEIKNFDRPRYISWKVFKRVLNQYFASVVILQWIDHLPELISQLPQQRKESVPLLHGNFDMIIDNGQKIFALGKNGRLIDIAIDYNGNIFVVNSKRKIFKIKPSGKFSFVGSNGEMIPLKTQTTISAKDTIGRYINIDSSGKMKALSVRESLTKSILNEYKTNHHIRTESFASKLYRSIELLSKSDVIAADILFNVITRQFDNQISSEEYLLSFIVEPLMPSSPLLQMDAGSPEPTCSLQVTKGPCEGDMGSQFGSGPTCPDLQGPVERGGEVCSGKACGEMACSGATCYALAAEADACLGEFSVVNTTVGSACVGDACGANATAGAACAGDYCSGNACAADACGANATTESACAADACAGNACAEEACAGDACGGNACYGDACGGNACALNACAGDVCGANACAIQVEGDCGAQACFVDLIPGVPFIGELPRYQTLQKIFVSLYKDNIVEENKTMDTTWMCKDSSYNITIPLKNEKYLLYNSSSGALAVMEQEVYDLYRKAVEEGCAEYENFAIQQLSRAKFLISKELDEFKEIEDRYNKQRNNTKNALLTIAPSMACNFACDYCFQGKEIHLEGGVMHQKVQDRIFEFCEQLIQSKISGLNITWYGGEPLIRFDIVEHLSERLISLCKNNNISYGAMMVSNGYLLNESITPKLEKCKIDSIQITLDGPSEYHDKRRVLHSGEGTFEVILENLEKAVEKCPKIQFSIRVNIDNRNVRLTNLLFKRLEERGLVKRKNLKVYFAPVEAITKNCHSISSNVLTKEDYCKMETKLYQEASKDGLAEVPYMNFSGLCTAMRPQGYVILPNGDVHKCWDTVSKPEYKIGNILEINEISELNKTNNALKWMLWTPFRESICRDCKLLPTCCGHCAHKFVNSGDVRNPESLPCPTMRYNMEERLLNTALRRGQISKEQYPEQINHYYEMHNELLLSKGLIEKRKYKTYFRIIDSDESMGVYEEVKA